MTRDREEKIKKYLEYRDYVLEGKELTPDKKIEYHKLEAEIHSMGRPKVEEMEADEQTISRSKYH